MRQDFKPLAVLECIDKMSETKYKVTSWNGVEEAQLKCRRMGDDGFLGDNKLSLN